MEETQSLYHDLYFMLFNRVTDAIRALDAGNTQEARAILCQAQQDAEERYISRSE